MGRISKLASILLCLVMIGTFITIGSPVGAEYIGSVTIRSDGTIYPIDAPISVTGDTYTMIDNINGSISIEKSGITLDGNGFSITGPGSIGIYSNGGTGLTIKSMIVSGFTHGIALYYSSNSVLMGNEVLNNDGIGIYIHGSDDVTLTSNLLDSNSDSGIILYHSNRNNINSNTAINNDLSGIKLEYSDDVAIIDNIASSNNRNGIHLIFSNTCSIIGNTASGNVYQGVHIYSSDYGFISENSLLHNVKNGISLSISNNSILIQNTVSGNDIGINLIYSDNNLIKNNTIFENRATGVQIHESNYNSIYYNDIIDNLHQLSYNALFNTWDNGNGEGNYWSDYLGLDDGSGGRTKGDGVGDTDLPHQGVDYYPIIKPGNVIYHVNKLIEEIKEMNLPEGIEGSLLIKLENVLKSIENDRPSAIGQLLAFINEVEAMRGNELTEEQADSLITIAQLILDILS